MSGDEPEHTEETSAYVDTLEPEDASAGFVVDAPVPQAPLENLDIWAEASPALVEVDGDWVEAPLDDDAVPPLVSEDVATAYLEAEEPEFRPEGDGPFAVALDTPDESNRFAQALQTTPATTTPIPPSVAETFAKPIAVKRKVPKKKKRKPAAPKAERAGSRTHARKTANYQPPRRYPVLMNLLQDTSGSPRLERAGPPVPGTFFPAPRETAAPAAASVSGLDGLLSTMAEGLLIGESSDGHAEVRITLRDEFFAGTELRLVLGERGVRAELHPPDRTTYWHLSGEMHALSARLSERGLSIESLEVCEP